MARTAVPPDGVVQTMWFRRCGSDGAAEEAEQLGLGVCSFWRIDLRAEDPRLANHGVERLEPAVGAFDALGVERLVLTRRPGEIPTCARARRRT